MQPSQNQDGVQAQRSELSETSSEVTSNSVEKPVSGSSIAKLKSMGVKTIRSMEAGRTLSTGICLSKAAIGAGVLTMAAHASQVGLIYQFIGLLIGGIINVISMRWIAMASVATDRFSFEDICDELFHPALAALTGFINASSSVGGAAAYIILCGQIFQVMTGASDEWRRWFIVLLGVFVCMPLSLAKHVSFMRHLAAVSLLSLLFMVYVVAKYLSDEGLDESITIKDLFFGPGSPTIFMYINSLSNVIFAYSNSGNVPQLTGELYPIPNVKRMTYSASLATATCFVLYGLISVIGVLAFGVSVNEKDTLILDLKVRRKDPLVIVVLLAVTLSTLTCFQFCVFPIRQFVAYLTRKARGREARGMENSERVCLGKPLSRWFDITAALGSVALTILIAVVITSLMKVLDFIGAFAAAYLAYIIPPLMVLQIRRREDKMSWLLGETVCLCALLTLGLFFFVFGTYSSLKG